MPYWLFRWPVRWNHGSSPMPRIERRHGKLWKPNGVPTTTVLAFERVGQPMGCSLDPRRLRQGSNRPAGVGKSPTTLKIFVHLRAGSAEFGEFLMPGESRINDPLGFHRCKSRSCLTGQKSTYVRRLDSGTSFAGFALDSTGDHGSLRFVPSTSG